MSYGDVLLTLVSEWSQGQGQGGFRIGLLTDCVEERRLLFLFRFLLVFIFF